MIRRPPRSTLFPTRRSSDLYIELAADIVSAFVSNNSVPPADLPGLIANVHGALQSAANPAQAQAAEKRSEEHTSELQSRQYLVCRLLLEKTQNNVSLYGFIM